MSLLSTSINRSISKKLFSTTKVVANGLNPSNNEPFTWENFFQLRKQENRINLGSSIFTAFLGTNISWIHLSTMEIDPTQMIFGFDPLLVISAGLMACGGVGYLLGPLVGSWIFKIKNKGHLHNYNIKNKDFLRHIIANRVNPSSQSFSNPVPDYYGEKIDSLRKYKQWLRDCYSYRRKAKEFI